MLNLYAVVRAGSFSRLAVDTPSLCEYYDLYGPNKLQHLSLRLSAPHISDLVVKS